MAKSNPWSGGLTSFDVFNQGSSGSDGSALSAALNAIKKTVTSVDPTDGDGGGGGGVKSVDPTDGDGGGGGGGSHGSGYSGPNYTAMIGAAATAGKRGAPALKDQISGSINNLIGDNDRMNALYDAADDLAQQQYNANLSQQQGLANDQWYRFTQSLQNSRALQNNQYSEGLRGAGTEMMNQLYRKTDDQGDQNILETLRQGENQYFQNFNDQINANRQQRIQNEINLRSQLDNVQLQAGADITNYINNILGQMSGYGVASQYMDRNGNLTQAGKDYVAGLGLGASINPDGTIKVDTSSYIPDSYRAIYENLGNPENHAFASYDLFGFRRTPEETNRAVQKQAEANKAGYNNAKTNPDYWKDNLGRRYG